jgi:hypothetical protein
MKRKELIAIVEKELAEIGFSKGQFLWQPGQLVLIIGNGLKAISLKASMTKAKLTYELGRIAGLAEAAGITPSTKPNGHAKTNGFAFGAVREGFAGMPA